MRELLGGTEVNSFSPIMGHWFALQAQKKKQKKIELVVKPVSYGRTVPPGHQNRLFPPLWMPWGWRCQLNWADVLAPHWNKRSILKLFLSYYYHTQHLNYRAELLTRSLNIFKKVLRSNIKFLLKLHYLFQAKPFWQPALSTSRRSTSNCLHEAQHLQKFEFCVWCSW